MLLQLPQQPIHPFLDARRALLELPRPLHLDYDLPVLVLVGLVLLHRLLRFLVVVALGLRLGGAVDLAVDVVFAACS